MGWGNASVRELPSEDPIKTTLELNLKGDFKSTDKKITWLSAAGLEPVPAEL